MLFQWNVWPVFFPSSDSKDVLLPPQPCSITIVGNGPSPLAGSVTSASSGTPSKVATRWVEPLPAQKRTPAFAAQVSPSGVASADAAAGSASTATTAAITTLPPTCETLQKEKHPHPHTRSQGRPLRAAAPQEAAHGRSEIVLPYLIRNSTFASGPTFVWLLLAR